MMTGDAQREPIQSVHACGAQISTHDGAFERRALGQGADEEQLS